MVEAMTPEKTRRLFALLLIDEYSDRAWLDPLNYWARPAYLDFLRTMARNSSSQSPYRLALRQIQGEA